MKRECPDGMVGAGWGGRLWADGGIAMVNGKGGWTR
ncbi:MAG: hypothetical protein KatS3mg107_0875 [Gemmataceae bacterium]|nr:MAG: hypothetical protein KatS3mg107_0875 [Gemmataceae bacterium]